jgi:CRISPR system Cascade subunit CasC
MFVELHILQNFAPSNLNRDDTGAPKDCEFGGYRRARISSQCLKRAVREYFKGQCLVSAENLAVRTKRIVDEVARRLKEKGRDESAAHSVVENALKGVKLKLAEEGKTQYLLFLAEQEIAALAEVCRQYWDDLSVAESPEGESKKTKKKEARKGIPPDVQNAVEKLLNGGKAADLALFGRMLADLPEKNIDAASQVAHAISTNKVSVEFDYYTAVDDLKPEDTAGADMIGTIEFNSACFYRYANVDLGQLLKNLGRDETLARKTLEAFIRASVAAIPTGKQNSMAAQNPPSFVMVVAREHGLWSLANAFLTPVRPAPDGDLIRKSVEAIDTYWGQLTQMYGKAGIAGNWFAGLDARGLKQLGDPATGFDEAIESLMAKVAFNPKESAA